MALKIDLQESCQDCELWDFPSSKQLIKVRGFMRSYLGLGVLGAGIGAGLMFLMDPQMEKRRRAVLRDKSLSLTHHASVAIDRTARDLRNRTYGTVVSIRSGHIGQIRPAILNTNWP